MKRRASSEDSDDGSGEERVSGRPAKKAHVNELEDGVVNGGGREVAKAEGNVEANESARDEQEERESEGEGGEGEGVVKMEPEDNNDGSQNVQIDLENMNMEGMGNENGHIDGAVKVEPDSQTLWIGNIPQTWNSEKLKNYVSRYGEVFSVVIKKGYGFVQFVKRQDAEKCKTELNNKESLVPNRRVVVNVARNEDQAGCQLQLRNLGNATEERIKAMLADYGRVMSLSVNRAHPTATMDSRRTTEIASVSLDKRFILEGSTQPLRAIPTVPITPNIPPRSFPFNMQGAMQPYRPMYRPMFDNPGHGLLHYPQHYGGYMNRPHAPGPVLAPIAYAGGNDEVGPHGANVYASNLPASVTPGVLFNMFAQHGRVLSASFVPGPPAAMRMAYVSYDSAQAAQAAIWALDKTMMGPCRIRVQLRVPQPGYHHA